MIERVVCAISPLGRCEARVLPYKELNNFVRFPLDTPHGVHGDALGWYFGIFVERSHELFERRLVYHLRLNEMQSDLKSVLVRGAIFYNIQGEKWSFWSTMFSSTNRQQFRAAVVQHNSSVVL